MRAGRQLGFTLPELVMTIAIVGILAIIVGPRFISGRPFESRGFFDEARAIVRYAQKTAIARRQAITVCVSATEIRAIPPGNDCSMAANLPHPASTGELRRGAPSGVTLGPAGSFSFDALGRPTPPYTITLTSSIAGDPARQILVTSETGYVP